MALAFLERQLRGELSRLGGGDLAEAAVGRITFTDDGSTVYLHLFPRAGWPHKHPGQAFVLAWVQAMTGRFGMGRSNHARSLQRLWHPRDCSPPPPY